MPDFAGAKHVRRLPLLKPSSKEHGETGRAKLAAEGLPVRSCESTRVRSSVRERLLGQVGVEVSRGSVGNLFQSSLQMTRRPNEPGQGPLLWASPANPKQGLLQQSRRRAGEPT